MSATALQRNIQIAASGAGHRLWRNNVGKWRDAGGRWIRYGLAEGSADLIGIRNDGRFISLEVKHGRDRLTGPQLAWMLMVLDKGGIADEVRSVEEALQAIERG